MINRHGVEYRGLFFSALSVIGWCFIIGLISHGHAAFGQSEKDVSVSERGDVSIEPAARRKTMVNLYFFDPENSCLRAEQRLLISGRDPVDIGAGIVRELIAGPTKDGTRTVPKETRLRSFFVDKKGGTAYVDLSGKISEKHFMSVTQELMAIYSITNSLVLNVAEIKTVKILLEGKEATTMAGHIDLRFPFKPNVYLIK